MQQLSDNKHLIWLAGINERRRTTSIKHSERLFTAHFSCMEILLELFSCPYNRDTPVHSISTANSSLFSYFSKDSKSDPLCAGHTHSLGNSLPDFVHTPKHYPIT